MAYLNKVMLIGNLGKDPEIRVSQASGRKRVSFSIATSRRYRDNNGEQKEDTQWHTIVGWGKICDIVEQLQVKKGTTLYVEGTLTNRKWTDQATGQDRYATEVNMDTFQLLTPRTAPQHPTATQGNPYGSDASANGTGAYAQDTNGYKDPGDDLPF